MSDAISSIKPASSPENAKRLLWAGFMAILAAGIGFGIRGGIFGDWAAEFGFTGAQLGAIGGAGFSGFCFGIIIGGVIVDRIGYGKLVIAAFLFHALSAVVTFAADKGQGQDTAYQFLYWGMFLFGLANGTLEAVANPLVATLFPGNRTHYLNILHASWPAGMLLGGMVGWFLGDAETAYKWGWRAQLALFLIPTVIYGAMFLGRKFPRSEASATGLGVGEMFKDVGILGAAVAAYLLVLFFQNALQLPVSVAYGIGAVLLIAVAIITRFSIGSFLLFALFIGHALVGAVELGTDGWIQNITGNILTAKEGKQLFVFTCLIMFGLRFCAHAIEKGLKLSPVGLLLVCALLAVLGLNLTSGITTFQGALLALGVYALGKTFFWPTMLAVVGDRFPRSGAIAMSIMGGIGMMSAGMIGNPGLGYAKDRYAAEALTDSAPNTYLEYRADKPSQFLFLDEVKGLDGTKLEAAKKHGAARTPVEQSVVEASVVGDRKTLRADSFIPGAMAAIYLIMLIYFKAIGGYKPVPLLKNPYNDDKTTKMG